MAFSFTNRKVFVTGAAGGLGTALVQKFYESGATVYAVDIDGEGLAFLKAEFPHVHLIEADLTKWNEIREIIGALGPMHHLVNNAGLAVSPPFLETTEQDVDITFNLNFKAALNLSQVFAKIVIENGIKNATIVNISSIAGMSPLKDLGLGPVYPLYLHLRIECKEVQV